MSDQDEWRPSQMIGEYRLLQELGRGSFGTVHQAEHIHEHSQVAIKILQVPLTKRQDFRDFLNETRMMIRLRHSHITPLLDVGLSPEDFPFIVMEYASEGTLRDRHPKGSQVPLATIVEYVEQIASALQYAHDHRIIHRDVKPENMLLRADGTLLLSDFGIAKIIEHTTLMSQQKQIGTPAYMAPEQHKGLPCFASDQYALAVVIYEWISGKRPFEGTLLGLTVQHMHTPPPSLLDLLPTLSPSIEQVIFKALSKEPEQRFATIQEFAAAFRAAVQESTVSQADTKNPLLDKLPSKEPLIQRPVAPTSMHAETRINIPPAPRPAVKNQSIEPEIAQIRQAPAQMNSPRPSNGPYTTSSTTRSPQEPITLSSTSKARKVPRRASPFRINLLVGGGFLAGLLILIIVLNMMGFHAPNSSPSPPPPTGSVIKMWAFQTGGIVDSSPRVVNGVVYVGSENHNVYAIDAQSGKQKWVFPTGAYVNSSPTAVDGVVYVGSDDGKIYAIDAQSGQQKWVFQTGSYVNSSPAVVDGVVYVGSWDNNVYAIDVQSGQQKWVFQTESSVRSSPAVVDGVVYVGSLDQRVYAIDAQSGLKKWAFQTKDHVSSSPRVVNGVVYVGSEDHNVYAIDAQSGLKKWVFPTGNAVYSSPAVADGIVYVGSLDQKVYAIDAQSGQQKWVFPTGKYVYSSPAVVDSVVYVGSLDHNVYAIDAQSGHKKWFFPTGAYVVSSPAVVDGVVYVGSEDGNVYALGLPTTNS